MWISLSFWLTLSPSSFLFDYPYSIDAYVCVCLGIGKQKDCTRKHSYMLLSGIAWAGSERMMFTLNDEQHPLTFINLYLTGLWVYLNLPLIMFLFFTFFLMGPSHISFHFRLLCLMLSSSTLFSTQCIIRINLSEMPTR